MEPGEPRLARLTIGVIGSGSDEHEPSAAEVGGFLARAGVNLLTGGGAGVMLAVSRAYVTAPRRTGICIGIIPSLSEAEPGTPKHGYPNEFIELPIFTHLPHSGDRGTEPGSRNHINVLSAAGIIALPGGAGTASELRLALRYGKPLIAFSRDLGGTEGLPAEVARTSSIEDIANFVRALEGL